MIGFFSQYYDDGKFIVMKDKLHFVHIPDGLSPEEIHDRFAQEAQVFANKLDANIVYLNYGKDEFIKYEYSI